MLHGGMPKMQQSNASGFNLLKLGGGTEFIQNVMSMVGKINTGELVEVTAVEASGTNPVGFVSVKPLTQRIGADNNNIELSEVHNVPYFRISGGVNAVICDPQVGDIGFCGFCSRDISLVKRVRGMAAQNMSRVSDISDAFFFGGWSANEVEQYIWFDDDQIKMKAKSKIVLDAPEVEITNNLNVGGGITAKGIIESLADVVAKAISMIKFGNLYNSHKHKENGTGGDTDAPNNQV